MGIIRSLVRKNVLVDDPMNFFHHSTIFPHDMIPRTDDVRGTGGGEYVSDGWLCCLQEATSKLRNWIF